MYTPPATPQGAATGTVGVHERPERTFRWRMPLVVISLLLGVLVLLWTFGIFA